MARLNFPNLRFIYSHGSGLKSRSGDINIGEEIKAAIKGGQSEIRLGVTGLSRAGKTVFITSLVANLLERERMALLSAESEGRIITSRLDEQPDATLARFEFEKHLSDLLAKSPAWPESTRNISELRLSFRVERRGAGSTLFGETKIIHLDIIDYPGEWLLDLGLMEKSYREWSEAMLAGLSPNGKGAKRRKPDPQAAQYLGAMKKLASRKSFAEPDAASLAQAFRDLAVLRRSMGVHEMVPGRFLLPGELEGAPAITFAPLPADKAKGNGLYELFERRFEAYKREIIRPFFRDHFLRLDRQAVLVDILGALEDGAEALRSLEGAMADILLAFRPGRNNVLSLIFGGRIDRIAFIATKADLLHHHHHERLVDLCRAIMEKAERRALYHGAQISAKAVASIRTTIEDKARHEGGELFITRGRRAEDGKSVGFHFGDLPDDAEAFVKSAIKSRELGEFGAPLLAPPDLSKRSRKGLPHIRMDQLAEFLLGDKLR